MSFKEVTVLRKSDKLKEAYEMAKDDLHLDPTNIWSKRSMAWVLYALMKENSTIENYDSFINYFNEFIALELPGDEDVVFSSIGFQIGSIVFALAKHQENTESKIISLYERTKLLEIPVQTDAYSFVFKAFHKGLKDSVHYLDFVDWWGLENFIEDDFIKGEVNGKQIMSVVEQAYIAYSKRLLLTKPILFAGLQVIPIGGTISLDIDRIHKFLPNLDDIINKYPEYQYPIYFKAKLMLAIGDQENLLNVFIPFAKSKKNDFWVWDVMSEIFEDTDENKLACLCKALSLKAKDDFLIKVRTHIIPLLLAKELYAEAKFELDAVIELRLKNQWKVQSNLTVLQEADWYKKTSTIQNNKALYNSYKTIAEQILYSDLPEEIVVIEYVNSEKKIANFIKDKSTHGFFKYSVLKTQPKLGEVYKVRLEGESGKQFYKVYTLVKVEDHSECKALKLFSGNVTVLQTSNIGFVDSVFIGSDLVKKHELVNKQEVSGNAILSFNKKKNVWGWKALLIT
jgi:tetratricopeptide (TPR) repeat protein